MAGIEPRLSIKGNHKKSAINHCAIHPFRIIICSYRICNFWKTGSLSQTWHQSRIIVPKEPKIESSVCLAKLGVRYQRIPKSEQTHSTPHRSTTETRRIANPTWWAKESRWWSMISFSGEVICFLTLACNPDQACLVQLWEIEISRILKYVKVKGDHFPQGESHRRGNIQNHIRVCSVATGLCRLDS